MNLPRHAPWALVAAAAALLLAGCAGTAVRTPLPPAERAAALVNQQAREATLAAHPDWQLEGRVALTNQGRGGSGRIEWRQRGSAFEVALSAPITRQGWRLTGDRGQARIDGLDGGPRQGSDPDALLREATGWEVPIAALASWVRGARAPSAGAAQLEFGVDGRLARLQQDGWTLDFSDWRLQSNVGVDLPMRINATRDNARVRLVVDAWTDGDAAP
ncbi:MAG: lipoprotein insertase outer membrane protein LolB [Luteimonas sp.]